MIQRTRRATVTVGGDAIAQIGAGLVVLVGVAAGDTEDDALVLADKTVHLRIFPDAAGQMNRSCLDVGGAVLAVSQFTLMGDARKGRRPGFGDAARPEQAEPLFERYLDRVAASGVSVARGRFGADMQVELVNDGPVTILLDSRKTF